MKLALALTMAATAMNLVAAAKDNGFMPYTIEDDDTETIIVGYEDQTGYANIKAETKRMKAKGLKINEVNHPFKGARVLNARGAKSQKKERMLKKGKGKGENSNMISGYSAVTVSRANAKDEIESFRTMPGVVSVEMDTKVFISTLRGASAEEHMKDIQDAIKTASDQIEDVANHGRRLAEQTPWGIEMVNSDPVNQKPDPVGATPIKICVVDTGYDDGHVDLPTSAAHGVAGFSPYSGQQWDVDGHGHGTHCAGTIGAIGNSEGVTSVNPDPSKFKFFIGKGLTDSGSGSTTGVMAAVQACVDAGAKVVSLSLGGGGYSSAIEAEYDGHYDDDVLFIAAAGNGGSSSYSYPASYPALVSIAALDSNKNKAGFSQYNDQVELAAPGVSVLSTLPNDQYQAWSGTSMATPHVAGVAALIWYHFPSCTNNQIRNVMIATSEDLGANSWDSGFGWGLVNAEAAYNMLAEQGCEAGGPLPGPDETLSDQADGGQHQQWVFGPTPPPSPAPTAFCPGSDKTLKVEVLTDNYPGETTWSITNECDQDHLVMSGGPYGLTDTFEESASVCGSHKFKFTINDSYGDGICCGYGSGNYKVLLDGDVLAEGGEFGSTESKVIGAEGASCDATAPPTTAPPTTPPTAAPVASTPPPTTPPVAPPTTPPVAPPTTPPVAPPTTPPVAPPTTPPPVNASTNKFVCAKDDPSTKGIDICDVGGKCEEEICPYCLDTCWVKSCVSDNDNVQEAS